MPSIHTSLGHLIWAGGEMLSATATAARNGSSSSSERSTIDISSASPGSADPHAPLPPAPRALLVRGHERPVRRPGERQLLRPLVRRVGRPVMDARQADHRGRRATVASGARRSVVAASPRFTAIASSAVGVLVQDHVAGADVGERLRERRDEALAADVDLDCRAERQARAGQVRVARRRATRCRTGPRPGRARRPLLRASPAAATGASGARPARRAGPHPPARRPPPVGPPPARRCRAPWNVADTGSRRWGERLMSTASTTPPHDSHARLSRPLSGPTSARPSPVRNATPRRSVPTCGSTIATWTPTGT